MRTSFALSVAALAGSALAAPRYGQLQHKDVHVVVDVQTLVQTVYVTEGNQAPEPTPVAEAVYEAPVVTSVVYEEPAPAPTSEKYEAPAPISEKYEAPSPTSEAQAPPAPTTSEASAPAPAPTNSGYQGVVDTWRSKMGMKPLENSAKLEANTKDCVVSWDGKPIDKGIHKMNPGTFGQVCAPGNADDFEHVFVGGWLCEMPSLPGLDGVCATQSEGYTYDGQTGHAEILTSDNYSQIGCDFYKGIWCCDLA